MSLISRRFPAVLGVFAATLVGTLGVSGISASASGAGATTPVLRWLTSSSAPDKFYGAKVPSAWHADWAIMNQGKSTTGCHEKLPRLAIPAFWFGNYWVFRGAVRDGEIAGKTATPNECKFAYKAVVVDYENWGNTPINQRKNWQTYVKMAYTLAHSLGLTVIQAMTHGVPGTADKRCPGWAGYFSCHGVSAPAYEATYADVVDIQAQQEQGDLRGGYYSFNGEVKTGAAQARKANPHVLVLAGMRSSAQNSNGSCTQIKSTVLIRAWSAVEHDVNGAWLNTNCDWRTFVPFLKHLYG